MTCKFCDACGAQIPLKDSYQDKRQKYSIKMTIVDPFVFGAVDHERFLKFCPDCGEKVKEFLDKLQEGRPGVVAAALIEE